VFFTLDVLHVVLDILDLFFLQLHKEQQEMSSMRKL